MTHGEHLRERSVSFLSPSLATIMTGVPLPRWRSSTCHQLAGRNRRGSGHGAGGPELLGPGNCGLDFRRARPRLVRGGCDHRPRAE
jgi:hypothetical protein